MTGIIENRRNKPTRRMAERFSYLQHQSKTETPKEWDELPLYINTQIITKITGISMPTISKFITGGELKASKIAGKWLICKEDFKAFMISKQYVVGEGAI